MRVRGGSGRRRSLMVMVGNVSCGGLFGCDARLNASKNPPENRLSGFDRRFTLASVGADDLVVRGDVAVFAG